MRLVRFAAARNPEEPEYRRWTAEALERLAETAASRVNPGSALTSEKEAVEIWRGLYVELPNSARRSDLQEALARALQKLKKWKPRDVTTRKVWEDWSSELETTAKKKRSPAKATRRLASQS